MRFYAPKLKVFAGRQLLVLLALVPVLAVGVAGRYFADNQAAAATSSTINFQARLMNAAGAIAPDGDYNVEFKIYDTASTGGTAQGVCTGNCKWVETRTGGNRVHVANGYISVSLGSVTAFPATIDWDQELWITMNIGGTGTPAWDGEMSPRLKLTAVPYAFRAGELAKVNGGNTAVLQFAAGIGQDSVITLPDPGASTATVCYQNSSACGFLTGSATDFIQNQNASAQTAANFWISGTGRADTALQSAALRPTTDGTTALRVQNAAGSATALSVDTINNRVAIGNGGTAFAPQQALDIIGNLQVRDASTQTKSYRFRTSGSDLDLESAGRKLYISNWENADYTGTQRTYLVLENTANMVQAIGAWHFRTGADGTTRHIIDGSTGTSVTFNQTGESTNFSVQGENDASLLFVQGSTDRVGIGTNTPDYKLHVAGTLGVNSTDASAFRVQNAGGTNTVLNVDTANGRVGIGTAAPSRPLHIYTNNAITDAPTLLVEQAGSGDTTIELKDSFGKSFFVGMDASGGGAFKIASSTSANTPFTTGTTGIGGSVASGFGNEFVAKKVTTSTSGGTVASISVYVEAVDGTNPGAKVALYAHNSGTDLPGALIAGTTTSQNLVANSWNTIPISGTLSPNTTYWIAINLAGGGTQINYNFCSGCGGRAAYFTKNFNNPWPDPGGSPYTTGNSEDLAMYVTATPNGAVDSFNGVSLLTLTDTGSMTLQNSVNSSTAFQVLNSAGTRLLGVDTSTPALSLGAVGSTAQASTVNVATSTGAAQTINIGSATSGTAANGTTVLMQGGNTSNAVRIQALAGGTIGIGTANAANTIQIGSATLNSGTQTINIGNNNTSGGTTNITIGSGASATGGSTTVQAKGSVSLQGGGGIVLGTNSVTRATFDTTNTLYLGPGVTSGSPGSFTVRATGSSTTGVAGGTLTLQGGNATTGNANGGNLLLNGGTGIGAGSTGLVILNTPTFQTASAQNCGTNCTITQANIDSNGAVVINATAAGLTVTMNDPTITTAGRIVYVTAANGSNDFTLQVNGGGTGNQIAMRQNTTATMVWNGSDWTAAGASSSTTLQAAYNNTLTSAGGAELVVSNSANANGLTIRDSGTSPVNGTLLEVQTSAAANLFSVNGTVTDYASNGGAESALGSEWAGFGTGASVTRNTTATYISNGTGSVRVATTGTANTGARNTLNAALTANLRYNVSFAARLDPSSSGSFTDLTVYYSNNGTNTSVACSDYSTQTIPTSVWTKVNCTFTASASGITTGNAILIRQTAGATRAFYVDNLSVTISADLSYATDGSVGDAGNFGTNWVTAGLGTVSVTRTTSTGNDASDSAQVQVTAGAANAGVRNRLSINPLPNTLYRITVYVNSSNAFNDFKVRYSRDGSTTAGGNYVDCVDYNTQSISSTPNSFTKVTCYITTDGTAPTNPYVYFVETASATRTFYVDTFSMVLASNAVPNVQVGGGVSGGPTTLFTLDRGASAPIASDNEALLGSMYYDTTLGKLQCYEADGWGACGSSPDNIITISPEYTNAVLHGSGVGTMTSDLCSDGLNINDGSSGQPTICGTNETYNFYKWTSPQASAQTYSIYVTYQLPTSFKTFQSGQTSIMGRTDSSNATVQYSVYRNSSGSGLTQCGSTVAVSTGSVSSWQTGLASGAADPSTCGFSGGDSIVFKIDVIASSNANAYVGNLNFTFTNQ